MQYFLSQVHQAEKKCIPVHWRFNPRHTNWDVRNGSKTKYWRRLQDKVSKTYHFRHLTAQRVSFNWNLLNKMIRYEGSDHIRNIMVVIAAAKKP